MKSLKLETMTDEVGNQFPCFEQLLMLSDSNGALHTRHMWMTSLQPQQILVDCEDMLGSLNWTLYNVGYCGVGVSLNVVHHGNSAIHLQ